LNPDFRDILSEFSAAEVRFLLVGAYALAALGLPRSTGDIDLWVQCDEANARRILVALARFGAPLGGVSEADFARPGIVYQIGVAPSRIDVLTMIDGVEFDEAWEARSEAIVEGVKVPVIGRDHLLRNKRATGRPKDMNDVRWLESHTLGDREG
jgi:hypothetical protein